MQAGLSEGKDEGNGGGGRKGGKQKPHLLDGY